MIESSYFAQRAADERMLAARGFARQPDVSELADYCFSQADKLDALIAALGMEAKRDVRGRWRVAHAHREAV